MAVALRSTDAGRASWFVAIRFRGAHAAEPAGTRSGVSAQPWPASSVVAGSLAIYGATGIGVAPAADTVLGCTDTWTGGGGTTDWNTAANWSAGVPDATGVDACIPGGATVVDQDATAVVGELTVAKGSTLSVGTGGAGAAPIGRRGTLGLLGTGQRRDADRRALGLRHGHPHPRRAHHEHRRLRRARHGDRRRRRRVEPDQRRHARGRSGWCAQSRAVLHAHECVERAARLRHRRSADVPVGLRQDRERGVVARRQRRSGVRERVHSLVGCRVRRGQQLLQRDVRHRSQRRDSRLLPPGRHSAWSAAPRPRPRPSASRAPSRHRCSGRTCRFTATVTPASGSDPTGSVSFSAGGVLLGTTPVATAAGVTTATLDTANLPVGSQPVTATYGGDVLFGPSTSPVDTQVVHPDAADVSIEAAPADAVPGQQVTYTATVSAAAPGAGTAAGTVSLSDDGSPVAGCESLTLSSTASPAGHLQRDLRRRCDPLHRRHLRRERRLPAVDGRPQPRRSHRSPPRRRSPRRRARRPPARPSRSPPRWRRARASANPTGSVTFSDNGAPLGTSTLTTSGGVTTTSMLLTTLPLGVNSITASYSGDPDFAASSSGSAAPVTVSRASTTLGLGSSANPSTLGQPVTITASVFPATGSGETGTVTFFVRRRRHRQRQRVERPGDPHHRHAAPRDRLGHRHLRGRRQLHRQCHHGRLVPGGRSPAGLSARRHEAK